MWKIANESAKEIVDNICPYCKEHLLMNKRSFANHVRWCKKNPMYEEIRKSTISKIKQKNVERRLNKRGELKIFVVKCDRCGCEFEIQEYEKNFPTKEKYYCSESCAKSHKKTEETKKKISESVKAYARNKGMNIRDNILKEDKICLNCGNIFHTIKAKQIFCCNKCGAEYRVRQHYKTLLDGCEDVERVKLMQNIYRKQCVFRFALKTYPNEFDFDLIKESGWYKAKNHGDNLKGISRDHMLSVNEGFRLKIDPYLISHPANCSLMPHSKNSSKHDGSSITLEELKERINAWEEKYGVYENKIDYKLLEETLKYKLIS